MSAMSNRPDPKDSKIRVLLVNDNRAFLHAATDFLQRQHELLVVGAIRGYEKALAQARDLQPQVILIGLDAPGLIGLQTIPRLRSTMPGVGIIALTLLDDNAYRQAAMTAGADDLIAKAELTTDLLPAIWRVTQAKRSRYVKRNS